MRLCGGTAVDQTKHVWDCRFSCSGATTMICSGSMGFWVKFFGAIVEIYELKDDMFSALANCEVIVVGLTAESYCTRL